MLYNGKRIRTALIKLASNPNYYFGAKNSYHSGLCYISYNKEDGTKRYISIEGNHITGEVR